MATQVEVADAFFEGDVEPYSASNFRMHTTDGGLTAYIVSDGSLVLAKREPMGRYTVFGNRVFYNCFRDNPIRRTIHMSAIRNHQRLVINRVRSSEYDRRDVVVDEDAPPVTDFDALEHLHP